MKNWWLALFAFLIIAAPLAAADTYISNSKDWKDVYTVHIYAGIMHDKPKFLVSDKHGPLLLNAMEKTEALEVFSSRRQPYVVGYESMIRSAGFNSVKEEQFDTMNLDLVERLPDTAKQFVIIDDAYGYNAIAVAPYAMLTGSYVIFANSRNIAAVMEALNSRDVSKVIIYGHVDRQVLAAMKKFNPEIINKDGDRFANNVEIVKKYREINPQKQVVLTNGEFMEAEIMSGLEPVLFIGRENVPDAIKKYIQGTDIEVGVLIGNELVGTATIVRRQVGISTFVKFAQGARTAAGNIAQVEGLDMFPVPKVAVSLEIISVKYNKLTGMIEITFKNTADIAEYFKGTYTLKVGDQEFTFGDLDVVFIDRNDVKTLTYKVEGVDPTGELTLKAYVIYGEAKNALEFVIDKTFSVTTTEESDEAQIAITKVQYDKNAKQFLITIENIGEVDAYVNTEIVDILIMDERVTLGSEETIKLAKGQSQKSIVAADLADTDLEANPTVHVKAHYGEREEALIKILEGDFEVSLKTFNVWTYLPILIIILLLLLLFGRKKCKNCGHKNPRGRKHCKKCGHKL
jgi:hypothetical protein